MPTTLTYTGELTITSCWCGIRCAIPTSLYKAAHNGTSVYCPLGHKFSWHETDADRLRKQLDAETKHAARLLAQVDQARADADHERSRANGYKGALTKAKKRIGNGMCPCCNRHFTNVERHMATQHPTYATTDASDG